MLLAVDGVRVRELRETLGMTQKECCEKAGISAATLKNVESGRDARPSTMRAIGYALGVDPKSLATPTVELEVVGTEAALG